MEKVRPGNQADQGTCPQTKVSLHLGAQVDGAALGLQPHHPELGSRLYPSAELCTGLWAERMYQGEDTLAVNREGLREAQREALWAAQVQEGEGSWSGAEQLGEVGQPQPAWTSRALAHKSSVLSLQSHSCGLHLG